MHRATAGTLTTRQNGFENTISIDRVVEKPTLTPEGAAQDIRKNQTEKVNDVPMQSQKEGATPELTVTGEATSGHQLVKEVTEESPAEGKYDLQRVVRHEITPQGWK